MIGGMLVLALLATAVTLVASAAAALWVFLKRPGDGTRQVARQLAESEHLRLSRFPATVARGSFRGRKVRVTFRRDEIDVAVATTCRFLEVRPATLATAGSGATRTGDTVFDEQVNVRGTDPAELLAILDGDTRLRLRHLVAERVTIEHGEIRGRADTNRADALELREHLARLAGIAEGLEASASRAVPARLAEIAGSDPVAPVRRRALEIISERFGTTAFAAEAARRALADADSGVRAQAAPMGSGSGDALESAVRDEKAPEKDRRDALARAGAVLDRDEMVSLYEAAVASNSPALQRDAISGFARLRHGACIPLLVARAQTSDDEATLATIADALANIAGPGAEDALLSLLEREIPAVQILAARGLGRIGSPASIARIQPIASRVVGQPDVREEAANAISQIRTRHPGAAEPSRAAKDRP